MPQELIALLMFSTMLLMMMTGQRVFGLIGFVAVLASIALWFLTIGIRERAEKEED